MNFFIPTPNLAMSAGILITWGLGCSCVAGNIYSRYFLETSVSPMAIQFWIRFVVVALGLIFFPNINFLYTTFVRFILSLGVGYLGGIIVVRFELWNERKYNEKLMEATKTTRKINVLEKDIGEVENFELGLCSKAQKVSNWKDRSLYYIYEIKNKSERYSLPLLLGVAFLEECIFRGYLLSLCFLLPNYLIYPAIITLALLFGAKHIHARSREFLAKSMLGIITTIETLLFGNIIGAVITHCYLNYYVYKQSKEMGLQ